ncbi:hypothetical protein [Nitratireductor sp. XY-223]|nr:hypothetical protein [Nitratireductor sp. XY-223]
MTTPVSELRRRAAQHNVERLMSLGRKRTAQEDDLLAASFRIAYATLAR